MKSSPAVRLAKCFHETVREYLSDHLEEIDRKNAENSDGSCATHDYCDANEIMCESYGHCMGLEPDLSSMKDCTVINHAWSIAVEVGFSKEFPEIEED